MSYLFCWCRVYSFTHLLIIHYVKSLKLEGENLRDSEATAINESKKQISLRMSRVCERLSFFFSLSLSSEIIVDSSFLFRTHMSKLGIYVNFFTTRTRCICVSHFCLFSFLFLSIRFAFQPYSFLSLISLSLSLSLSLSRFLSLSLSLCLAWTFYTSLQYFIALREHWSNPLYLCETID